MPDGRGLQAGASGKERQQSQLGVAIAPGPGTVFAGVRGGLALLNSEASASAVALSRDTAHLRTDTHTPADAVATAIGTHVLHMRADAQRTLSRSLTRHSNLQSTRLSQSSRSSSHSHGGSDSHAACFEVCQRCGRCVHGLEAWFCGPILVACSRCSRASPRSAVM